MRPGTRLLEDLVGADRASIPQVLAARCARTPEAPFVLHGGRRWTYGEAWQAMLRFAGFLQARMPPGRPPRVAGYLSKRPEALWAWFGTLLAGGVYVAVNRSQRGAVLADMLARSRASLLVTEAAAWPELPPLDGAIGTLLFADAIPAGARQGSAARVTWDSVEAAAPGAVRESAPGDTATLLFTSGTTGRSKAVLLPHNMYCRGAAHLADAFGFRADDVFHDWMPLHHIGGQLHVTMCAVMTGACLAQYDSFSKSRFWQQVAESRTTVFSGFATVLKLLMLAPETAEDAANSLRLGLIGAIAPDLQAAFERRFGVALLDTYGMSEAEPLTLPVPRAAPRPGSCGLPGPDFELAILDEEDRRLPPGGIGRIAVRPRVPDVMMQGYEGDEAATVAAWRNLWFHTQDLGRIDTDGFVYFVDRLKHSIRRGGENIAAAEVEGAIKAHPDVADCAVVGVPDALTGEAVKAAVVARPGRGLEPATLHRFCVERMAAFMVPRYIELMAALPYSDIGKVRREALGAIGAGVWDAESGDAKQGRDT